jgi:hypothetical protein
MPAGIGGEWLGISVAPKTRTPAQKAETGRCYSFRRMRLRDLKSGCTWVASICFEMPRSAHPICKNTEYVELFAMLEATLNLRVLGSIPRRLTTFPSNSAGRPSAQVARGLRMVAAPRADQPHNDASRPTANAHTRLAARLDKPLLRAEDGHERMRWTPIMRSVGPTLYGE